MFCSSSSLSYVKFICSYSIEIEHCAYFEIEYSAFIFESLRAISTPVPIEYIMRHIPPLLLLALLVLAHSQIERELMSIHAKNRVALFNKISTNLR